jgi:hypothetical protein
LPRVQAPLSIQYRITNTGQINKPVIEKEVSMGKSNILCLAAILLCAGFLFVVATSTLGQGSNNCITPVPTILLNESEPGTTDNENITNSHDCGRGHMGPDVVYQFTISGGIKEYGSAFPGCKKSMLRDLSV